MMIASATVVAAATLTPASGPSLRHEFWCLRCGSDALADVIDNVLLFVPLGFGLRLVGARRGLVLCVGIAFTIAIELLQIDIISRRDPSVRDILSNVCGAAAGLVLADHRSAWLAPADARRILRLAVGTWVVVLAVTARLLMPDVEAAPCSVDWAPTDGSGDWFHGKLLSASLNGAPLPDHARVVPDCEHLTSDLRRRAITVTAEILPGEPTTEGSTIVGFSDVAGDYFALSQNGKALTVDVRARADRWRLRKPELRLRRALALPNERDAGGSATPIHVEGSLAGTRVHASATRSDDTSSADLALTPFLGWTLVTPFNLAGSPSSLSVITVLFVAALLTPIGYWSAWRRHPWELLAVQLVLGLLPRVLGYPATALAIWVASAMGLGLGAAIGSATVTLARPGR